ncbi:soluble scavenger receptor cysteine-rich domain-containing protein SSC5D isoform X2 [Pteropus vampyrus]|uniref:Soluble scavenger receptor cysteine-rich domain-containing protein SSC5D n=1 Tax=Pteropus vampyrus TaxID=132908 RepID=A0A6P6BTS2_PTEVA|nr:soluble scavenger receptor cysteine-rich domain-containing protein SSC5D isoform X2 [Pteropus vampyrus]
MRVLACLLAALMGIQAVERLRLADGPHGCAGRLEVWHSGRWGTVCDDGWDLRDAAVACRQLGCGGALAAPGGAFFGEGAGPVWLSELACRGSEGQLGLCPHRGWKAHVCSHEEDAGIVCAGQRVVNSRDMDGSPSLLDGDSWPGLSGELSPSSEEPPVTHVPRPAGTPQSSLRKKSPRPPKQAKSTRAPALTAGAPHQERLRLVLGPHGCAGRLEVWHSGRWGTVCDDGWDLRDAAVACRELGCGGALAAPGGARFGPGLGPVWMDDVGCGGGEQALRDCPRSPWGRSNCDHSEDAGLVCTGPAPRLRLADGPHGCAGRLEVWHSGRWGSVCDDAWDLRDATVACRELGCGAALAAPGGAFFGEGTGPIFLDDLRCRGNETALRFCPSRPWSQHDCHHREDAGAVCDGMPLAHVPPMATTLGSNSSMPREAASRPLAPTAGQATQIPGILPPPSSSAAPWEPGPEAGSPQLRLMAGPSRCSGRLEVWHAGRWGTVCDDSWDLRDSAVVCRELGCGGAQQPDPTVGRFGWGAGPIWLDDVRCVGTEASLSDCPAAPWGKHNCAHNEDVGVTCTGTPGLDSISDPFSWSWIHGLGRDSDTWLPGELATKPSARLTTSVPEKTTKAPGKMPKSTKKWATKHAKRPTTQPPVTPTTKHSRGLGTQGPPELTLRTTALTTEGPHRLTSNTATMLSPRTPQVWTFKTVATPVTQGPQETTSEATIKRIPLASVEPSADIPAEGSPESSKDLASSPARSTVGGSGHTDEEDYPPWTWDPTSEEDLAQGTTAGGAPGHTVSWGSTRSSWTPSPATRHLLGPGDDGYEPLRTWDTPSGGAPAKGTPAAGIPGSTLTASTTRSPGHPSPAPGVHGDTGSGRKPLPERRVLRPTAARTAPPTLSPGPPLTSDLAPELIEAASREVTFYPPDTSPPGPDLASWKTSDLTLTTPGLTLSTPDTTVVPAVTPEFSPTPPPTLPKELTSDSSVPPTRLSPTSELTPESDTAPGWDTAPYPNTAPEPSGFPDSSTSPRPTTTLSSTTTRHFTMTLPSTMTPPSTMTSQPTTTAHPITTHSTTVPHPATTPRLSMTHHPTMTPHPTTAQPTTISHFIATPYPVTTPHPTMTPRPTTTTYPTMTHDSNSTPMGTTKSLLTSLGTELPFPTSAPRIKPSQHPRLTLMGVPHSSTSMTLNQEPPQASESSPSRPSPAPSMDTPSTENFKPPRSQSPKLTSAPPQTPHSASDPTLTPDLHLSSMAHPLDQPPPDHLTLGPTPGQSPGPLGPCIAPVPPVRVMACEPPALVELVAAVRNVGDQLQRLTQTLEQDQQERQALGLGLTQVVEAAQGLGQLGEVVKRLAEVAWPPSTTGPTTTTPEEEEKPLRGDV